MHLDFEEFLLVLYEFVDAARCVVVVIILDIQVIL